MSTLEEFREILRKMKLRCRWCFTPLPDEIQHYPHASGWEVEDSNGFVTRLWLYVTCSTCGYDWALWKLGIPREHT